MRLKELLSDEAMAGVFLRSKNGNAKIFHTMNDNITSGKFIFPNVVMFGMCV